MRTFNRIKFGNTNEIKKLMRKGQSQKDYLVRMRREESLGKDKEYYKSKGGSVGNMVGDTHWGYSPSYKSNVRAFKPTQLNERKDSFLD